MCMRYVNIHKLIDIPNNIHILGIDSTWNLIVFLKLYKTLMYVQYSHYVI